MRRRTFLFASATIVAVAGCGPDSPGPRPSGPPGSGQDPDTEVRSSVALDEAALIAAYRATIHAHPDLAAELAPWLAQHEEHLGRVDPSAAVDPPASATARPPGGTVAGSTGQVPTRAPAAVAELADLETRAREQRAGAGNRATSADLARALCLIAGSEGQHAAALTALARELRA